MTDQTKPSDGNGAIGPRVISVRDFQGLAKRVVSQDQRLEKILKILRTPVVATPSPPSTSRVPSTQEIDTPIVATSTTRMMIAVIPETVVLPPVQTEAVPALPLD
ncbi:hypothetical protein Sjap_021888 [Stephania japonica]|uniref:Uncharacterized protein n=1 Tax=Stephania japonica TaxID=461633 RepID=A0AAP0HTW6_9MAGN